MSKLRVLAIDPGLADTGVVMFVGDTIVDVLTITTTGNADRDAFGTTVARALSVADQVAERVHAFIPDLVVIEGYEDFGGKHLREARRRYTTPIVIGALALRLAEYPIRWQKASIVMAQYGPTMRFWTSKLGKKSPQWALLTNAHLRSAAAHGLSAIAWQRTGGAL